MSELQFRAKTSFSSYQGVYSPGKIYAADAELVKAWEKAGYCEIIEPQKGPNKAQNDEAKVNVPEAEKDAKKGQKRGKKGAK
jgi:hypothetical protein